MGWKTKLVIDSWRIRDVENPTSDEVEAALRDSWWMRRRLARRLYKYCPLFGGFAILYMRGEGFIQTANTGEGVADFRLERQVGDVANHFNAVNGGGKITLDDVVEAFRGYAVGDDEWMEKYEWEREGMNGLQRFWLRVNNTLENTKDRGR